MVNPWVLELLSSKEAQGGSPASGVAGGGALRRGTRPRVGGGARGRSPTPLYFVCSMGACGVLGEEAARS